MELIFNNYEVISGKGYDKESYEFLKVQIFMLNYPEKFVCRLERHARNEWTLRIDSSHKMVYNLKEIPSTEVIEGCLDSAKIEGKLKVLGL